MLGEIIGSIGSGTVSICIVLIYFNRKRKNFEKKHAKLIEDFCSDYYDTAIELDLDEILDLTNYDTH